MYWPQSRNFANLTSNYCNQKSLNNYGANCSSNNISRGLQQIEAMYKSCIVGLECYLRDSSDPYMQLVYEYDSGRSRYSIKSMACRFTAQLRRDLAKDDTSQSLHGSGTMASDVFEQAPQMDAKHFRMCNSSLRVRSWSRKPMHGQYRRLTEQSPVDTKETFGWLKAANLPGATEGLVVAAQDQALRTRYYEHHILHRDVSPTCRVCSAGLETVDHVVAGCSAMASTDYTDRHNQVAFRSPPSSTGTFVGIFRFQWSAGGIGINLIGLWRRMTS